MRDTRPVAIPAPVCRALVLMHDAYVNASQADKREIRVLKAMVSTAQAEANQRKMGPPFPTDATRGQLYSKEQF